MSECKVCLVSHQPEIHNATLSIRRWLREQLRLKLQPVAKPEPPPRPAEPPKRAGRERLQKSA